MPFTFFLIDFLPFDCDRVFKHIPISILFLDAGDFSSKMPRMIWWDLMIHITIPRFLEFCLYLLCVSSMIYNHKIAFTCRFGQGIQQNSLGSSLLKRYHLSLSQLSITVTLHRSMHLKMPSLMMKLSLRRRSERSLRGKTKSMTQCWALFVKSHLSSFFQIMSYLNKQRFPHNEIFKEKHLQFQS